MSIKVNWNSAILADVEGNVIIDWSTHRIWRNTKDYQPCLFDFDEIFTVMSDSPIMIDAKFKNGKWFSHPDEFELSGVTAYAYGSMQEWEEYLKNLKK